MKKYSGLSVMVVAAIALIFSSGCIWWEEDSDNGDDYCCYGPVGAWWEVEAYYENNPIDVGECCGCAQPAKAEESDAVSAAGEEPALEEGLVRVKRPAGTTQESLRQPACADCCWYLNEDFSLDTVYLDGFWDYNLGDLQLNYTLTNWSNLPIWVYVDICDYYSKEQECFNVIEITLRPREVFGDRTPTEVTDTLLFDVFFPCLDEWGDFCEVEYDIDVYLGEDCQCVPVTLDYYYDGFYLY